MKCTRATRRTKSPHHSEGLLSPIASVEDQSPAALTSVSGVPKCERKSSSRRATSCSRVISVGAIRTWMLALILSSSRFVASSFWPLRATRAIRATFASAKAIAMACPMFLSVRRCHLALRYFFPYLPYALCSSGNNHTLSFLGQVGRLRIYRRVLTAMYHLSKLVRGDKIVSWKRQRRTRGHGVLE
jgi:hypothetical protein